MKSAIILALLLSVGLAFSNKVAAQKKTGTLQRCATMEHLRLYEANNPLYKPANEAKRKRVMGGPDQGNYRMQGIVSIPVVVHIVLPNPYRVSDADVQAQIDRLNLDFAGENPDSTNGTSFYNVRGRSQIRFALARRTPAGLPTNGIERRFSTILADADANVDPIKRKAMGGLDAWNSADYLNLWVGMDVTGELLGYASNIGPGETLDDGVFLNFTSFGVSSCYIDPRYNRGRTATHEVGHYFGLYHIWGDDPGTCSGDDFEQLPASTSCSLPTGLYNPAGLGNGAGDIGDTPNQGNATINCPDGVSLDNCAGSSPGKMYQNFMDYTEDACLSLFTKKQVARMEWVLDNCRPGLKTSLGAQPPAGTGALDVAAYLPVSPGGFELVGCQLVNYPDTLSCPGSLTPKFRVINYGASTITTLTAGYRYDNGPEVRQTFSVNIPLGGTAVISFAEISVTVGQHSIRFFTADPNGSTDQATSNDSFTQTFTVLAPVSTPLTEGFESPLPLQNWAIDNPNLDFTWQRTTPGRNGSAGKLSIDNFNGNGYGNRDDLRSTAITVDPAAAYILNFDVAHKYFPDSRYLDSLAVFVSGDCGQSFTRVYYKGGPSLATAGSSDGEYDTPSDADWRTETVNLGGTLLSSGKIVIVFRNISGYGNWIHLDNINLTKVGGRDLRITGLASPGAQACARTIAPAFTVENVGLENVTAFSVGYRIDNGPVQEQSFTQSIGAGMSVTVSLPQATADFGAHTITAFSFNPVTASGSGDQRTGNDTLRKDFTVVTLGATPVVEGFERAFPSSGWTIVNPNNDATWSRRTPGHNSYYAAFFDNYNNNLIGESDDIRTPMLNVAGADSIIVQFDIAYKYFLGADDKLSVLATTNCANSFTTVYSKTGEMLATADSMSDEYLRPAQTDWRTERITLDAQAAATGYLGLAFRSTNGYGNNLFLDNISIESVYKRDVRVTAIQQPKNFVCSSTITPAVVVRNLGTDTVKAFKIVYAINGGSEVVQAVTGLSLARGAETTVTLPPANGLTPGTYNLRVYTTALQTANGATDMNVANDTLSQTFSVAATVSAPLVESFTGAAFPPSGWSVLNNDASFTWQRYSNGNGNSGSAFLNTYVYETLGQKDELVTPLISYGAVDSVKLSFDVAAAMYSFPGLPGVPLDTLQVLVTNDCGNSFTTVYKKWGADLVTTSIANTPQTTEFYPASADEWRKEAVDLSAFASQGPVAIFFRVTNNNENNVFMDNINVSTKTLPSQLKQLGYLVYPAPFQNSFTVWHYLTPANLKYIRVMNAAGQTIWTKQFSGNAQRQEPVDMTGRPAGLYIVEIGYSDGRKAVTQKLMKQ